jgi:hypothetical protein
MALTLETPGGPRYSINAAPVTSQAWQPPAAWF